MIYIIPKDKVLIKHDDGVELAKKCISIIENKFSVTIDLSQKSYVFHFHVFYGLLDELINYDRNILKEIKIKLPKYLQIELHEIIEMYKKKGYL